MRKIIAMLLVVVCVPLWPQPSRSEDTPDGLKDLATNPRLRAYIAAMLEVGAIYKVGKNIVPIATKAFPILSKAGPVIGDISVGLAPVAILGQEVLENDERLKHYYEMMWGTFLNDPKLLGPSPNDSKVSYIRDVFNMATSKVNKAFQDEGVSFQISPSNVFVSDTGDALNFHGNYPSIPKEDLGGKPKPKCGLWGQGICPSTTEQSYFFVPITDFAYGDVVERVAIDIAAQALVLSDPPGFSNYISSHRQDGTVRHWYSHEIFILTAAPLYAAQILHLPAPESLEASEKSFSVAYAKYLDGFNKRIAEIGIPDTLEAREKRFLSFRIQRFPTTISGPESGSGTLTPCQIDIKEKLFVHSLPECRTLHIEDVTDDPRIRDIYHKLLKPSLYDKAAREFYATFWPAQADVLMILLTDALIGSKLIKVLNATRATQYISGAESLSAGAKQALIKGAEAVTKIGRGAIRFVALPAGTAYVTDKAVTVVVKGTKYDLNTKVDDPELLTEVSDLILQSHRLNVDPNDPNFLKDQRAFELKFQQLLLKADPQIVTVLEQITQHPAVSKP